ncbi:MAG: TRAP transporter substrate-binding protein DctP [Deltaproteobacteria bacterium]|nr:TRAP transporter substrate-binding protein DctP [Deltaproteobacteria bacterium]
MKKQLSGKIFAIGLALLLVTLLIPLGASGDDKAIKWKFVTLYPKGTGFFKVYEAFSEDVKKMSGGRLLIQMLGSGEGVAANQVLGAVSRGLIQLGNPFMVYHVGELPSGVVELGLPGGPPSYLGLVTLFNEEGWKEILRKAYATENCYWINTLLQPAPVYLLTKKPINSLDDLANMKIRAPGAYGKMLSKFGVSNVTCDFSEVYTSLATGVFDALIGMNLMDIRDYSLYEIAKYIYPLPAVATQTAPILANMDAWNKLPDDLKAIVEIASTEFGQNMARKCFIWEGEAKSEMTSKGLKMSPQPSEADAKRWAEAAQTVWPEYAKKDKFSAELIKIQSEFIKKYSF